MVRKIIFIIFFLLFSTWLHAQTQSITLVAAANMPNINSDKGSYAQLATILKQSRRHNPATFFLFGGGSLGPSAMSAFDRGAHIIEILNMLEPDVMSINKREFSYFEDELSLRSYEAAFPFVASNMSFSGDYKNFGGLNPHVLIEKSGIKLGVVSVIDKSVISDYRLRYIALYDPLRSIKQNAEKLRLQGADFIILFYPREYAFISSLLDNHIIDAAILVDTSIETLSTDSLKNRNNHVLLNNAGEVAKASININLNNHTIEHIHWQKLNLLNFATDIKVTTRIQSYTNRLSRLLDEQIGRITKAADTRTAIIRTQENAFANFITDSLRDFFKTDIAMINAGAIRGNRTYQANELITLRDITKELPFRAHIQILSITGAILKQAVENGLSLIEHRKGRFLHFSGLKVTYNSKAAPFHRLINITIAGKPVDDHKIYTLATTDYLASGGDGFTMFSGIKNNKQNTRTAPLLLDVIVNAIRNQQTISPQLEARLVDVSKEAH